MCNLGIVFFICLLCLSPNCVSASETQRIETRVYASKECLFTKPEKEAILTMAAAVVVPKILEWVIDYAVKQLEKIRKEESQGFLYSHLYEYDQSAMEMKWNPSLRCLTAITAEFGEDARESGIIGTWNPDSGISIDLSNPDPDKSKIASLMSENDIQIVRSENALELYSIYEVRINFEPDQSAFRLEHLYLLNHRMLDDRSKANQVYSLEFLGPGPGPNGSKYVVAAFDFGQTKPGQVKTYHDFKSKKSGLIATPGMSLSSYLALVSRQPTGVTEFMPIALTVTNTQVKKPSDAAKFVATILRGSKESLASGLGDAIKGKDSDTAEQDAEIAFRTADLALATAEARDDDLRDKAIALALLQKSMACESYEKVTKKKCDTLE